MKLDVTLDANIAGMLESEILAGERAVTGGVRDVGDWVKVEWRRQVTGAGLGQRLANTIRQNNYPARGESMGAAALVYARPNRKKKSASAADVIDAFDRGALIKSPDGFMLAIPLSFAGNVAGSGRRGRLTPYEWELRTGKALTLIKRPGKHPLLVADGTSTFRGRNDHPSFIRSGRRGTSKKMWIPVFVLVPQARLKKRLDLAPVVRTAGDRLPAAILRRWK